MIGHVTWCSEHWDILYTAACCFQG